MNDLSSIVIASLIFIGAIGFFIMISIRIRRGGGSMTTIALGATDEFLSKEQQKSAEIIVNQNAGKIIDKQVSGNINK
jgi:hypothetical protein